MHGIELKKNENGERILEINLDDFDLELQDSIKQMTTILKKKEPKYAEIIHRNLSNYEVRRQIEDEITNKRLDDLKKEYHRSLQKEICHHFFFHNTNIIKTKHFEFIIETVTGIDNDIIIYKSTNDCIVVDCDDKYTYLSNLDSFINNLKDNKYDRLNRFKNIYGGIAGFTFTPEIQEKALENGLFILTQNKDKITLLNDSDFSPKNFNIL
jgi:hypothetical protein